MKDDLVQITVYCEPAFLMSSGVTWREHLIAMKRDMIHHGRLARIDRNRRKEIALFANDVTQGHDQQVMRDATLVNVRTLEG